MKKIVMGIAAVAMAASMFAADVSGRVHLDTKVFDTRPATIDGKANPSSHKVLSTPASMGWDEDNTFLKFAASTENSGAELWLQGEDAKFAQYSIWFKPVDAVKITIGDIFVNDGVRGTFAWWDYSVVYKHNNAILVNANVGPVALEIACSDLINWDAPGYGMVGDFWLGATFGLGDAGSLKVVATKGKGADLRCYGMGGWSDAGNLTAGIAYDNMPWQTTGYNASAFVKFDNNWKFNRVFGQVNGQLILDAVNLRLVNVYGYADKFKYGFLARAELKTIDNVTP
ncbi:MAG: hypothetical protein MR958_00905, partial [Spirochaetia bacterium]|nr:hypothetical protein [Spirochaetia bacterium]